MVEEEPGLDGSVGVDDVPEMDEPAAEVDTDEDLADPNDAVVFCLWGRYEPARLGTISQALYHCTFDDDEVRWATASELVHPNEAVPERSLQPGATILVPLVSKDGSKTMLMQGTLTRRVEAGWEVRTEDTGAVTTHPEGDLRLPVIHGGMLGRGMRPTLQSGDKVLALRGAWRRGTLLSRSARPSRTRGYCVHLTAERPGEREADVWVSGGQLAIDQPADASSLVEHSRLLARPTGSSAADEPALRDVLVQSIDYEHHEALCVPNDRGHVSSGGGGPAARYPLDALRNRLASSFRVLCASGGFQRATVAACTPDGLYAVSLTGGAQRWVSASELISPLEMAAEAATSEVPQPGTLVAVAPELGAQSARWLCAAYVASASSEVPPGSVALRRAASQRPLSLVLTASPDPGQFGFGIDGQNRVSELPAGRAAATAGLALGDRVLTVDGQRVSNRVHAQSLRRHAHARAHAPAHAHAHARHARAQSLDMHPCRRCRAHPLSRIAPRAVPSLSHTRAFCVSVKSCRSPRATCEPQPRHCPPRVIGPLLLLTRTHRLVAPRRSARLESSRRHWRGGRKWRLG